MRMISRMAYLVMILSIILPAAHALPEKLLDQRNDETTGCHFALTNNIRAYLPVGQTFVPSRSKLMEVDVFLDNDYAESDITLHIREGSIDGPSVVSQDFSLSPGFRGWAEVKIRPPVRLNPGNLYVIELEPHPSSSSLGWVSDGICKYDTYVPGEWLLWGAPRTKWNCTNDFAFRTFGPPAKSR